MQEVFHSNQWAIAALIVFLLGAAILVIGVSLTTLEIWISHVALNYEMRRLSSWKQDNR